MLLKPSRKPLIAFVLISLLMFSGCVKGKLNMLINSDRSGKFSIMLALRGDAYAFKFGNKKSVGLDLDDFEEVKGVAAWLRPKEYKSGGYKYIEVVGYFEDVNKLHFKDRNPSVTYTPVKGEDDTHTLKLFSLLKGDKPVDDNQVTRDLLKDVELTYSFKVPGKVEKARKWQVQGRDAVYTIDLDELIDVNQKKHGLLRTEVTVGPAEKGTDKELEAFKKELDQAKKEWEQYRKELEQQEQ